MKNIRNYIIVSALAFIVVVSCFFMPELTDLLDGRKEKTYSFETNKTSFSVSDNVPFALRFTEVLPVAEKYTIMIHITSLNSDFVFIILPVLLTCFNEEVSLCPQNFSLSLSCMTIR